MQRPWLTFYRKVSPNVKPLEHSMSVYDICRLTM